MTFEYATIQMACKKCSMVYDVTRRDNSEWHVAANDARMVEQGDGSFLPLDFKDCDQIQAFGHPSCLNHLCLGELSVDPIEVEL